MKLPGTVGSLIPWWALMLALFLIVGLLVSLAGCAAMDYEWSKPRAAAPKPWLVVEVANTDYVCRSLGADPMHQLDRINGCADWNPIQGCIMYVPVGAPSFIVEHERRHCEGWVH